MQFKVGEKVMVNGVPYECIGVYTDGTLHLSKLPEPAAEPETKNMWFPIESNTAEGGRTAPGNTGPLRHCPECSACVLTDESHCRYCGARAPTA